MSREGGGAAGFTPTHLTIGLSDGPESRAATGPEMQTFAAAMAMRPLFHTQFPYP